MKTSNDSDARQLPTLHEIRDSLSPNDAPHDALQDFVTLLGNRLETDVCSVYLLEPDHASLVLTATVGLNRQCIGKLRMGLEEGLAGLVAQHQRPVAVAEAARHPRFKYFPEAEEDAYQSFLGVPFLDCGLLQGVLVAQTIEPRCFSDRELHRLQDATKLLGPIVRKARIGLGLPQQPPCSRGTFHSATIESAAGM